MDCPLCHTPDNPVVLPGFYDCTHCGGRYRDASLYPNTNAEKSRYEEHNNDVNDPGYQRFVQPITDYILQNFSPANQGLDFGSGTGPVISKLLTDKGYSIRQYDPFFANHPELLEEHYHYIACCEVMEHFHRPDVEFSRLHKLLHPQGALVCMTHLYTADIHFANWYYKNDPTHVFFYTQEAIAYIARQFNFSRFEIDGRRVVFLK